MKFNRKIVIGSVTLAFTLICFTGVTYAWLPIHKTVSVSSGDGSDISVSGGQGFMVSIDDINYSNDLTKESILEAILLKYQPDQFRLKYNKETGKSEFYNVTVTTEDDGKGNLVENVSYDSIATTAQIEAAFSKIELMPVTSKDGIQITDLYNSDATAASGRYIDFSVYFRATSSINNYYKVSVTDEDDLTDLLDKKTWYSRDDDGNWVAVEGVNKTNYTSYYLYKESGSYKKATSYSSSDHYYTVSYVNVTEKVTSANYTRYYVDTDTGYKKATTYENTEYYEMVGTDVTNAVTEDNYSQYYVYDGMAYDIYLNGEDKTDQKSGSVISPTKFISTVTTSKVSADMTYVLDGATHTYASNEGSFSVYTSNALRMSITDESQDQGEGTLIYELNDYVNGASNYGSYATNYSDLYYAGDSAYSSDLDYKYGYQYNAMYTYYSNLKKSATLQDSPLYDMLMDYSEMPHTIKDLVSKDSDTGEYLYNKSITRLLSGAEDGTLITFRIWLEGWDADCFDGLKEAITTQLSFTSTRIY